jgi:hypothetical protein
VDPKRENSVFVQIMEFDTKKPEEIMALMDEWRSGTMNRNMVTQDMMGRCQDRPNHYVAIMHFPSEKEAQRNNKMEETERFAKRMAELCDGPIVFGDYDMIRDNS